MSLYDKFNEIFTSNKLKDKNGLKFYFEGIPRNQNDKISYTNILVDISSNKSDIINFINEDYLKIDNNDLLLITNNVKNCFKFKDLSQESFIIDKCLKEIGYDKDKQIKEAFVITVQKYKIKESKSLNFDLFVNFCAKLAYLIKLYNKLFDLPSIVYFGSITKARIYFLNFLNNLGFNTIIINTQENKPKQMIPLISDLFEKIEFEDKEIDFKIPNKEIVVAIETNAYKAEQQVNSYYDSETGEVEDIVNVPIKTSYNDVFELWITPVNERKGYRIKNGVKYIPNILCKVNGVENDKESFREKFKKLITKDSFIITDKDILTYVENSTRIGKINLSVLKKNIKSIILNKKFNYSKDQNQLENDLSHYLNLLGIDINEFLNLIQQIDRDNYNPKLIIVHNSNKVSEDVVSVMEFYKFCRSIGFDIIMFSNSGYSGIEELEDCNSYELDEYDSNFRFNLKIKEGNVTQETGFFRKLFGGR